MTIQADNNRKKNWVGILGKGMLRPFQLTTSILLNLQFYFKIPSG